MGGDVDFDPVLGPLIGAAAALAGVGLSELVRRRNRAETYAQAVFGRRLDAHERLFAAVRAAGSAANAAFEVSESERDEAKGLVFAAGLTVAEIADEFELYIDELGAHCTALWLNIPDILDTADLVKREALIAAFRHDYWRALDMIRDESGLSRVNQVFRSVTGSRLNSPIVDYIRELRERYDRR